MPAAVSLPVSPNEDAKVLVIIGDVKIKNKLLLFQILQKIMKKVLLK